MKNSQKGFAFPPIIAVVVILVVIGGACYMWHRWQNKIELIAPVDMKTQPTNQSTTSAIPSAVSTTDSSNQNLIQCGSVNRKILTQYDYQPTETEKEATIKSLTCINQAIIKCSPASLTINNINKISNINVKGQGKLGCNVSIQKYTGEVMTCPLPSDYIVTLQNKFAASNYDATIIADLATNINAEISSGNKSGDCTVTK